MHESVVYTLSSVFICLCRVVCMLSAAVRDISQQARLLGADEFLDGVLSISIRYGKAAFGHVVAGWETAAQVHAEAYGRTRGRGNKIRMLECETIVDPIPESQKANQVDLHAWATATPSHAEQILWL